MTVDITSSQQTAPSNLGLHQLNQVELNPGSHEFLERALANCGGSPAWKARKKAEGCELVALAQIAPRMTLVALDLSEMLRALIRLIVPVACRKDSASPVYIEQSALLGLTYREEAMRTALPGYAFMQVLDPHYCWHSNISKDETQALCLGATLPPGVRCRNLIVMAYGALALQAVQLDMFDPAGVMNAEAAYWWQQSIDRIPLTKAPFLSPVQAVK